MGELRTIKIAVPPGLLTYETALSAGLRYIAMQGMRFWKGKAEKLGGNIALTTTDHAMVGEVLAMRTWNDLTQRNWLVAGTEQELAIFPDTDFSKTVITPTGLASGLKDPASGTGWGAGGWNVGTWDTPRTIGGISYRPRQWSFGNFGKLLIAAVSDHTLYSFDPTGVATVAAPISGAPSVVQGAFVTSENTIIAYGSDFGGTQDLMQFWTSGQNTIDDWNTLNLASTAGASPSIARRLKNGNRIVGGADLANNSHILLTDSCLYLNQYTGSKYVYSTRLIGDQCGLVGPNALCTANGQAFWISNNSLMMFDGSVKQIQNSTDIVQWLFDQMRPRYPVKSVAFYNTTFNEVWFGFVTGASTVPNLWLFVSTIDWTWGAHRMDRTAAASFAGTETRPLLADTSGIIREHEMGHDDNGGEQVWRIATGAIEIDPDQAYDVHHVIADMQRQVGTVAVRITAYDRFGPLARPTDEMVHILDPADDKLDVRVQGRACTLEFFGRGVGSDVRFGIPKLLVTAAGGRP